MRGDTADAVKFWEQAARINPAYDICMQLNTLYRIRGDLSKANYYYDLAEKANRERKRR